MDGAGGTGGAKQGGGDRRHGRPAGRVLVTGGAGFIGSHLVDELLVAGHDVRVYDDFSTGRRENLAHVAGDVEVVEGDVRDLKAVRTAMVGCDSVVHLAAVASVTDSYARLDEVDRINVGGTVEVLRAARELGVGRVVFASSCAVYGDTEALPVDEATPTRPLSPYAVGKLAGEGYCAALAVAGADAAGADAGAGSIAADRAPGSTEPSPAGLDTVAFRFFNVYGPRQDAGSPYSGVIAAFMAAAAEGRDGVVHGDGEQTRDFVFVQDVARALVAAVAHEGRFDGRIVNLGSGTETSVNAILEAVRRVSGAALPRRAGAAREGDIRRSRAAVSLAADLLDWRPSIAFDHGLALTWQWYARRGAARDARPAPAAPGGATATRPSSDASPRPSSSASADPQA